jgi:hypothetical protein
MLESKHGFIQWRDDNKFEILNLKFGRTNIQKKLFHRMALEDHFYYVSSSKNRYVIISKKKDNTDHFKVRYLLGRGKVLRKIETDFLSHPSGKNGITVYLSKRDYYRYSHDSYRAYFKNILNKCEVREDFKLIFKTNKHYEKDRGEINET